VFNEAAFVILNSPFDPDAALGGASAQGFAKYMGLYSKCFALEANIKVRYCLTGPLAAGSNAAAAIVGVTITTNSATLSGVVNAAQQGLCDFHLRNQSPDSGTLALKCNFSKFADKPDILDDPQWFCTSSSGPTQIIVAHLWAQDFGVSTNTTLVYTLEVEMDLIFTDPVPFT